MTARANPPLPFRAIKTAKQLRARSTDAERLLWAHLRAGRLLGHKFRRQHPIPPYVVDFYCHAARLAVELDGSQHDVLRDRKRTDAIARQGVRILRFWDNQVLGETPAVLEAILAAVEAGSDFATPPSGWERL